MVGGEPENRLKEDIMNKIGEIKGISNVGRFLKKLSQSFPLSEPLRIVMGLINPTHYSYFVNLELREEANYECSAYHTLKIDTFSDNSLVTGKFYYQWITSSDHKVVIESNSDRMFFHEDDWQDNHCESYKPIFNIFIGEEESSCFYPTIKNIFADMQKG